MSTKHDVAMEMRTGLKSTRVSHMSSVITSAKDRFRHMTKRVGHATKQYAIHFTLHGKAITH